MPAFIEMANLIKNTFPKETIGTYYCPSSSVSKFQKGKLYNALNKYRLVVCR